MKKLYIGNLSFKCTEKELRNIFNEFGNITECIIIKDNTGSSRGFAFISFENDSDAENALKNMNNKFHMQRPLKVNEAHDCQISKRNGNYNTNHKKKNSKHNTKRNTQNQDNLRTSELTDGQQNPDCNPYNFAEWFGDKPWFLKNPEDIKYTTHQKENTEKLSGIIDITYKTKTPVFVPSGMPDSKSSEFFHCIDSEEEMRFAVPGSTIKGTVRTLFEILTNSRAGVSSSEIEEVPLYRRRAAFLFKVIEQPSETKDGKAIWCKFDFLDSNKNYVSVYKRKSQLNLPNNAAASEVDAIQGIQYVEEWKANLLNVNSTYYKHSGGKCKLGYVEQPEVEVTIPAKAYVAFRDMYQKQHRHIKDSLFYALNNNKQTYNKDEVIKYWNEKHKKNSEKITKEWDELDNKEKKKVSEFVAKKWLDEYPIEFAGNDNDLIFGITDNETEKEVKTDATLKCFGRNINFLWPAPFSPIQKMGDFAAGMKSCPDRRDLSDLVFGIAGDDNIDDNISQFRGRLRFTSFWGPKLAEKKQMEEIELMPLTSPSGTKAKCRTLYIKDGGDKRPAEGITWMDPRAKPRGRKLYWHQKPSKGQEIAFNHRYDKMKHTNSPEIRKVQNEAIPHIKPLKDCEFQGSVHFSNLENYELGALLASLNPSLLWPISDKQTDKEFGIKVGKGKPRGLGSIVAEKLNIKFLKEINKRYTEFDSNIYSGKEKAEEYVKGYKKWAEENSGIRTWDDISFAKDLKKILAIPQNASLRFYPPPFDMYGWMPDFGKADGEPNNYKFPEPMDLARNINL